MSGAPGTPAATARRAPVSELATLSLVLTVIGGVTMAAYAPRRAPLPFPIALLIAAGVLSLVGVVLMIRIARFAWKTFWQVFQWALLAYVIEAGMIGYVFVHNKTPGGHLAVLMGFLFLFATNVPLIIAFTVAIHDRGDQRASAHA
jgi:energy-coupling factor transporter transmembrane protein EcfT